MQDIVYSMYYIYFAKNGGGRGRHMYAYEFATHSQHTLNSFESCLWPLIVEQILMFNWAKQKWEIVIEKIVYIIPVRFCANPFNLQRKLITSLL